ncbi:hypothetical protein Q8F55_009228 [Vanrija albida]|uniref:Uncharacterized protein n=1 Tax=Vanrija albida TaxID=181172 RepID=A0ABR3PT33_9TREE
MILKHEAWVYCSPSTRLTSRIQTTTCLSDFAGYLSGPTNYDGDFGGQYAGSFIVVNVGKWAQLLDIDGKNVFDISLCPSDHTPQANQPSTCFPLGMNVGKQSMYFGVCELFCAECFSPA